jgi:hypothetical protein
VDYIETFSPITKPYIIRIILALAVQLDWPIKQLGVSNAFFFFFDKSEEYIKSAEGRNP